MPDQEKPAARLTRPAQAAGTPESRHTLGESVEEAQGNSVNSPVPDEKIRHAEQAVGPAAAKANMAAEPAVIDAEAGPRVFRTDRTPDKR